MNRSVKCNIADTVETHYSVAYDTVKKQKNKKRKRTIDLVCERSSVRIGNDSQILIIRANDTREKKIVRAEISTEEFPHSFSSVLIKRRLRYVSCRIYVLHVKYGVNYSLCGKYGRISSRNKIRVIKIVCEPLCTYTGDCCKTATDVSFSSASFYFDCSSGTTYSLVCTTITLRRGSRTAYKRTWHQLKQ